MTAILAEIAEPIRASESPMEIVEVRETTPMTECQSDTAAPRRVSRPRRDEGVRWKVVPVRVATVKAKPGRNQNRRGGHFDVVQLHFNLIASLARVSVSS